ncbi:MAG: glutamyl-tRNA reductase, partial [Pseudomonadota bacterium]|nr:glutamyl-tRNA reductase [Pseudomonadota bacterium]
MMSDEAVLSRLIVVGASHRTSPEAMRDRLVIAEEDVARFLHGICAAGFTNAVALSTCARTEIFGLASDMTSARESAVSALAELGGVNVKDLSPQTYFYEAENALRHLLR